MLAVSHSKSLPHLFSKPHMRSPLCQEQQRQDTLGSYKLQREASEIVDSSGGCNIACAQLQGCASRTPLEHACTARKRGSLRGTISGSAPSCCVQVERQDPRPLIAKGAMHQLSERSCATTNSCTPATSLSAPLFHLPWHCCARPVSLLRFLMTA